MPEHILEIVVESEFRFSIEPFLANEPLIKNPHQKCQRERKLNERLSFLQLRRVLRKYLSEGD